MATADTVFLNGKVATVDERFRFKRAIAVKNGWIIDVGENDEIQAYIGPQTQVIDLQGKLILPAAHDAHVHIGWLADSWRCVNCSAVRTLVALHTLLRERAAVTPPGQWIRACGLNPAVIAECVAQNRPLTRQDIDAATSEHPTILVLWDGHSCVVNSRALALAGITRETPNPPGGEIGKAADGEPDGNFLDIPALQLATQTMPRLTVNELKDNILAAQRVMNREGYASYTEGAMGPGEDTREVGAAGSAGITAYRQLQEEGKLTARVSIAFYSADKGVQSYAILRRDLDTFAFPTFPDRNWLDCHTVKIFCDGVPMSHTAWMNQAYADRPGFTGRSVLCGPAATEPEQIEELNRMILLAHQRGYQLAVHAVGDKAVKTTIDGFVHAIQTSPGPSRRHYVLHGSMGDREDFVRAAKYDILLSEQPSPGGSAYDYERRAQVCGIKGEIGKGLKDIIDLGVTVAGGSDGIMDLVHWRQMVQAAVTRKSASSGKVIRPELAISVEDGVRMYTINAAYQEFQERVRGSIEVGKVADFQVLDRDIFSIAPDEVGASQVLMTMVDGKIVWQKTPL
ncbi:amidohydrolase [Salmonella enterica subsp. salamae]|nr:amidohydrolase [Salmonella enterica]EBP4576309.1 amidohydrolase [Salmonella enterica]ECJ5919725.1 amidohydrolase [Salmonella enterica subsp. salamae]ECW0043213.1 amidohydrolase [Salmonella enterica]